MNVRVIFRTRDNESLENLQISKSKTTIYIYIYSFIEGNAISDNILLLSAGMENLTGLVPQAALVCKYRKKTV